MDVVFMGTPGFAVPTLEKLYEKGHNIKLVVTQPDKPSGRGKKLKKSEIKEKAEKLGLNIYQPVKIRSNESIEILKDCKPDVIVVVAYGQILSEAVLKIPRYGCINVHASLLPKLRGAAPINWAIISGEKKSGVTTMLMDIGLDTGDMLLKSEIDISDDMTVGELHDRLMTAGADLLIETLEGIEKKQIIPIKQDESVSSYAPMLDKKNTGIDWNEKAQNIHNKIRGLSPWPCAYFIMEDKTVKLYKSSYINSEPKYEPGFVIKSTDEGIYVQAEDGIIIIKELQMPGKNRMDIGTYLRGNKFPEKILLK